MNKKKILAAFLLASIISANSSCSGSNEPVTDILLTEAADTTQIIETAAETEGTNLEMRDMEGAEFSILNLSDKGQFWNHLQMVAEEENGDTINDAIYTRNLNLSERINIAIKSDDSEDPESKLSKSVSSGDNAYNIAYVRGTSISRFLGVNSQILFDLASDIPNINLNNPWWTKRANQSISIAHRQFFAANDISLSFFDSVMPLAMNLNIAKNYGLENPYELVRSGKWTMDKVGEMMLATTEDLNGDGEYTLNADRFGMFGMSEEYPALINAGGSTLIAKDENDIPFLNINNERFISVFAKAVETLNQSNVFANFRLSKFTIQGGDLSTFTSDYALFYSDVLFWLSGMRDMESDFAILPRGKFDDTQNEYYSAVHGSGTLLCIPVTTDPDFTGYVTEEFAFESYKTVIPAYYDTVLSVKYARDEDSVEMLDIIFESRVCDLGILLDIGSVYSKIMKMGEKGDTDVASLYASIQTKAESQIEKLLEE